MIGYQLRMAWKSLRRNPGHTAIVAGGIALGVAVSTVFATVRHSYAKDPIPDKSDDLYYVRVDNWGPNEPYPGGGPPTQVTYQDLMNLMRSDIPVRQSGMFKSFLYVFPDPKMARPQKEIVRQCFADFFAMFQVPFRYGGPWDREADAKAEQVVVLGKEMNDRLFGGEDSVGRTLKIENREFKVVGVLDEWKPSIKFYDLTQNPVQAPEQIYIPFNLVVPMQPAVAGNQDAWKNQEVPGFAGLLAGESVWLQFWVELPTADHVARYKAFVDAYTLEQKKLGRFPRPLNNKVQSVKEWMDEVKIVPKQTTAMLAVSLLFLLICALNLIGLLLGKFLARAPEIGVRRAMGARRLDVFVQHIVECEMVALVGGAVGLALSLGGLWAVNLWTRAITQRSDFFQIDWAMAAFAAIAALAAGLVAGVYPALRVCRIPPATHLRMQ
jgi:putative ABC transport system permease protein